MADNVINIFSEVGGDAAITTADGERIHKKILRHFDAGSHVVVDFKDIEFITACFIQAALGQLCKRLDPDTLKEHVNLTNLSSDDTALLNRVLESAVRYFKNPRLVAKAIREAGL